MNKFLISSGTAQLGAFLMQEYDGIETGTHSEELMGYFAKLIETESNEWNAMGHGFTYDLAITSLYLLIEKNELPTSRDSFLKSRFYLEN